MATPITLNENQSQPIKTLQNMGVRIRSVVFNRSISFFALIFILFENIYCFVFLCIRKSSIKVTYKPEEEQKQSKSAEKVGFIKRKTITGKEPEER